MQARMHSESETQGVKRYLTEYRVLVQRREALMHELDRLEDATQRATTRLSLTGRTGQPDPTAREAAMLRVVDGQDHLKQLITAIGAALAERLALIERMPDERFKALLTLRYINGLSWEEVGYGLHYERTQVFALHKAAIAAAEAECQLKTA